MSLHIEYLRSVTDHDCCDLVDTLCWLLEAPSKALMPSAYALTLALKLSFGQA